MAPKTQTEARPARWHLAASGFVFGAYLGLCADLLGINKLLQGSDLIVVPGLLAAVLNLTRGRVILPFLCALLTLGVLVIGYTPLTGLLMPHLSRTDRLEPCPAIVVLSASVHKDKSLNALAQSRVLQGYLLLREKYAPRLVLTQATVPYGSQVPTVRRQMRDLGIDYPIDEVGPVGDTHDEALAVARLARQRGWNRVILVTQPWHMRRAAAVFEKAGLPVLCSPCVEGDYDLGSLKTPGDRLQAFRNWLHECVGYLIYQRRGWV